MVPPTCRQTSFLLMTLMNTQFPTFTWPCTCGDTEKTRTVLGSLHSLVCSVICGTPKVGLILLHSDFATVRKSGVELGNTSIHLEDTSIITKQYSSPLVLLNWI